MRRYKLSLTPRTMLTCLLAFSLIGSGLPVPALAEMTEGETGEAVASTDEEAESAIEALALSDEEEADDAQMPDVAMVDGPEEYVLGGHGDDLQVPSIFGGDEEADLVAQASLPSEYYSSDYGCITPVRNQNPFGTCWAFSTIAAIEASMLKRGPSLGYTADTLDLSERHLAYFTYNLPQDPLHNTDGDKMLPRADGSELSTQPPCYLNNTGSIWFTSNVLWSWTGAVMEDVAPYSVLRDYHYQQPTNDYTRLLANTALSSSLGRQGSVRLKNMRMINMADISEVKRAVMDYGAAGTSLMWDDNYYGYMYGSFYYYYDGNEDTNHIVTIVGWKDSIATSSFGHRPNRSDGPRPKKNGAWLCKNSWGPDRYDGGYFWLSYEDACLLEQNAYVFEMEEDGLYDNLYQYDGTPSSFYNYIESGGSIANVFEAKANARGEQLKAVSFFSPDTDVRYSCQIYLDPVKANDPTSGVAALSSPLTGTVATGGIIRLDLPKALTLAPGARFAVVVTLSHTKDSRQVTYAVDASKDGWYRSVSAVSAGQSFERDTAKATWKDLATVTKIDSGDEPKCCARIKALTVNYDMGNKLKVSNATVSVDSQPYIGSQVTPDPKVVIANHTLRKGTDYTLTYKNNVEVGTATVTIKGKGSYSGSKSVTFRIRPFKDVTEATSHADDIEWLASAGISAGWGEDDGTKTFRPNANVKRGDMAAFLFRLAVRWGVVRETWQPTGSATFDDVTSATSHRREIIWLAEMGISRGWKVGRRTEFRPNDYVKRGDMAAFMYRLAYDTAHRKGTSASNSSFFKDVTSSTAFHSEIWWLAGNGVTQGWELKSGGREYRPNATVKRGDMAAFLHRLDGVR